MPGMKGGGGRESSLGVIGGRGYLFVVEANKVAEIGWGGSHISARLWLVKFI